VIKRPKAKIVDLIKQFLPAGKKKPPYSRTVFCNLNSTPASGIRPETADVRHEGGETRGEQGYAGDVSGEGRSLNCPEGLVSVLFERLSGVVEQRYTIVYGHF